MAGTKKYLSDAALQQALSVTDLTETHTAVHAVRLMVDEIVEGLIRSGWPRARIQTGPRIVSAEENYGLLGYDPAEITLGSEHTRWVSEDSLLRTQTTRSEEQTSNSSH